MPMSVWFGVKLTPGTYVIIFSKLIKQITTMIVRMQMNWENMSTPVRQIVLYERREKNCIKTEVDVDLKLTHC